jgi:RsiW-degrading membrane proteinase PrsW (M82 family)
MVDRGRPLPRHSIWAAQLVTIAGLLLYVAAVGLIAPAFQRSGGTASVGFGVVLAVVPVLLWLMMFYVQDAREPEPLGYVGRVAVAGAVLAGALALPVLRLLAPTSWLAAGPAASFLVSFLVIGAVQEFCKYLAVRFTVYETNEFDEVVDGVIYGTAAGLGVATTMSLSFVLASPSLALVPAALRIVVTSLSHAASGGVLGYFLGRAKMHGEHGRLAWGYVLAAALNGLVAFALREIVQDGLTVRPWNGLAFAAAVAVVVTLGLLRVLRTAPQGAEA